MEYDNNQIMIYEYHQCHVVLTKYGNPEINFTVKYAM